MQKSHDEKIKNRHGNYNIDNLIISIRDTNEIIHKKQWKRTRVNFVKYINPKKTEAFIVSIEKNIDNHYMVTFFPSIENTQEYVEKLKNETQKIPNPEHLYWRMPHTLRRLEIFRVV